MPYSLNFASGGTVSFTPKALRGTWAWELELEVPNTTNQRAINFNDNNFRYLRANSGFWDLNNNLAGLPNVTSTTPVTVNTRTVIRVEATADEVSWFIDGTPQGVIGTQTNDFILNNLNNTGNFTGKVYRFEVWENGILVESRIKQTLTSGNDRVYTDNVGTNDGALDAAFPADNSQWELFDAGGGPTYSMLLGGGDYSLIGGNASLLVNRVMQIDAGVYSITDGGATLVANRAMKLSQGGYSYVGGSAYLLANRLMSLQSGNYTYTGGSATLTYNQSGGATYTLPLDGGSYTVNAGSAGLFVNRTMQIDGGSYLISGGSSGIIFNRKMQLDGAAYLYTHGGVTILARRRMTLEGSSYNYAGGSVTLSYSGEVIALISGYTVQYKSDDVSASYIDDYIKARFQ